MRVGGWVWCPLLAASAAAPVGCSRGDAAPAPATIDAEAPGARPRAAARASAAADRRTADSPYATVLGKVGDVTVASYPARGFDRLTRTQRVLAYHLVAAAAAGDDLFTMQTSRFAVPARDLVRSVLASAAPLEPTVRDELREYQRALFVHHGLHDKWRSRKVPPPLGRAAFERALRITGIVAPPDLLAAMFDPTVLPMLVDKTPGPGKDPLTSSAANHYEGMTSQDLAGLREAFPLNGRFMKVNGRIVEQVYRAGDAHTAPGLGADELGRVVSHLEAAAALAPPTQRRALSLLIKYFRTGDNRLFRAHDILWLAQSFPVDYILGFVENYTDVRLQKGAFIGFVAIRDPEHDPPLQALAREAAYFEQKLPWLAAYKRTVFRPPAAAAVAVLAATGDGGPFTFGGANLPNPQDLRQRYGTKNFITASVVDTRLQLEGARFIDELAPEESRAELRRCQPSVPYAAIGFHEITGHGSGKVSPTLRADPSVLLAPNFLTLEEGRADVVADVLTGDPKAIAIGIVPDQGCARAYPAAKVLRMTRNFVDIPSGDRVEEDHLRADFIELGVLREKGVIRLEVRDGKSFFVVPDPEAWRRAAADLLGEYQRIKATGDKAALEALVARYGTTIDRVLRDEIVRRTNALDVPKIVATLPPILTPIRNAQGAVVDAQAAQAPSIDAYIEAINSSR